MLALALVAAGCGATPEEEAGGQSAVKNPGTFVHALEGEPESLDPARAPAGGYGDRAIIQVYEFLVDIPPDKAEPVPMLATQVPTQANKLVSAPAHAAAAAEALHGAPVPLRRAMAELRADGPVVHLTMEPVEQPGLEPVTPPEPDGDHRSACILHTGR